MKKFKVLKSDMLTPFQGFQMEIRFRAKRAAFNMIVTTPPLIVNDEFLLQDKKGIHRNCDGNTLELIIDGEAVKVVEIKKLMILRSEINLLINLFNTPCNDGTIQKQIIEKLHELEDKPND